MIRDSLLGDARTAESVMRCCGVVSRSMYRRGRCYMYEYECIRNSVVISAGSFSKNAEETLPAFPSVLGIQQ